MNITELIAKLEALRAAHGDLPVYVNLYDEGEECECDTVYFKQGLNDYDKGPKRVKIV